MTSSPSRDTDAPGLAVGPGTSGDEPTRIASEFSRRTMLHAALTSSSAALVVVVYLTALLRLHRAQWLPFGVTVGIWLVLLFVSSEAVEAARRRPFVEALRRLGEGSASRELLRAALASAVDLPRKTVLDGLMWYTAGGLGVGLTMKLLNPEFPWSQVATLAVSAASGGALASIVQAYVTKADAAPVRALLSSALEDDDERSVHIHRFPLVWKLRIVVGVATVVPVGFAILLSQSSARGALDDMVLRGQSALLARAARQYERLGTPGLGDLASEGGALGVASGITVLDATSGEVIAGAGMVVPPADRAWLAGRRAETGGSRARYSGQLVSWLRVPSSERLLVATLADSALPRNVTEDRWIWWVLLLAALAVAFGGAWLVAWDVGKSTAALSRHAEKVAAGELASTQLIESEDELGALEGSFARMATSLRRMVGNVASAAGEMQAAALRIADLAARVATVTGLQADGLQQATESAAAAAEQVKGISESSNALGRSVEHSSSSISELDATQTSLSTSASALSHQVEGVSSSIGQLGASIRQVAQSIDILAGAVRQSSSSMDEMAVTMQRVNESAGETARLSEQVIAAAEEGHEQVRQTALGMEAIREASSEAERTIKNLGTRTQQIGVIIDVIDQVVAQTNLLALNASIIAAQAGEHGRPFAVVASEIKALAERVLASTREIAEVIRAVQEESQGAVAAVERASASVAAGVEQSDRAGASLQEITGAARESGDRIRTIVSAVEEQASAAQGAAKLMDRVLDGVEQIRMATQEQEKGNEQVLRGSESMHRIAQRVDLSTKEQGKGTAQLRAGADVVRESMERIREALRGQTAASDRTTELIESVYRETRTNEETTREMKAATRRLEELARSLRRDVRRFRL